MGLGPEAAAELDLLLSLEMIGEEDRDHLENAARHRNMTPLEYLQEQGLASPTAVARARAMLLAASTLQTPETETSAAPIIRRLPPSGWDKYQFIELLGRGGMGEVWKAYEPQLARHVAIKFVRPLYRGQPHQFGLEARAQARLSHPNICKVFEVGNHAGTPYIAMQFIEGDTLEKVARHVSLNQKIKLFQTICQAVHQAHRAGLVHRDIKPANIMVERQFEGSWTPYVMDFGLAQGFLDGTPEMDHVVAGTPSYMPPEQARGQAHQLDPRADIYGLGATMYTVLTGQPPFGRGTRAQVMHALLETQPRPPRSIMPGLPPDLDSIVMRCLAKNPLARYGSARELAKDLARFLSGKEVTARPLGRLARFRKTLSKKRHLLSLTATAVLLLGAALGWTGYQAYRSGVREQTGLQLTRHVERMAALARFSNLAAPHDIREDRRGIAQHIAQIEALMAAQPSFAQAGGHYGLGRGALLLGQNRRARDHLERAWQAGYRSDEAALALGTALTRIYRQALLEAGRLGTATEREKARSVAKKTLRNPARHYLKQVVNPDPAVRAMTLARIAYCEARYTAGLTLLNEVDSQTPHWRHESKLLEGELHHAYGILLQREGHYRAAAGTFARADQALGEAALVARSDPEVFRAIGWLCHARVYLAKQTGAAADALFETGEQAFQTTLALNPEDGASLVAFSRLLSLMGRYVREENGNGGGYFERAVQAAERALAFNDSHGGAQLALARALTGLARGQQKRGQDPQPAIEQASARFKKVPSTLRDSVYFNSLGNLNFTLAKYQQSQQLDSGATLERALVAYGQAAAFGETDVVPLYNIGLNLWRYAHQFAGSEKQQQLDRAKAALQLVVDRVNSYWKAWFYLGRVHLDKALVAAALGQPSEAHFQRALHASHEALWLRANSPHPHNELGVAFYRHAGFAWERGLDPSADLQQAQYALAAALDLKPDYFQARYNRGLVYLEQCRFGQPGSEEHGHAAAAAVATFEWVTNQNPQDANGWWMLGLAHLERFAGGSWQHRPAMLAGRNAAQALHTALELHPGLLGARAALVKLAALGLQKGVQDLSEISLDWRASERHFAFILTGNYEAEEAAACLAWLMAKINFKKAAGQAFHRSAQQGLLLSEQALAKHGNQRSIAVFHHRFLRLCGQLAETHSERNQWQSQCEFWFPGEQKAGESP